MNTMRTIKRGLILSGIRASARVDFFNSLFLMGQWIRQHPAPQHFATREQLYGYLYQRMAGQSFDYLEFGVYHGASILYWANLCRHAQTRFYGFDTFTGLPEAWRTGLKTFKAGAFGTDGSAPDTADQRIAFIKGRFQETLPSFLLTYRRQQNVIVHCDADLFNSTLFVLTKLDPVMLPGTVLLFDNFSVANNDFKAYLNYTESYCRATKLLATAEIDFDKAAFEIL